jgi:poly(beta-D-mannuronate) C5 epimerase
LLPGDVLELDVAQGAFLLNFGHLSVAGATLRADPPGPGNEDGFRPFVASLGTGTLDVSWSVFVGLGSRVAPAASGLAVSSGSLFAAAGATSVIRDSRFIDVQGLTIIDGDRTVVTGNRFDRPRGVAIWVDDSQEVEVRGNYVVSPQGTFAARIDGPGRGVRFTDNVLVDGDHAGLRIAGTAAVVDLQGNVVSGFAGRGVVIEEGAGCIRLASNLIRENGGDGVSAQDVGDLIASGNVIAENGGAGVSLSRSRGEAEILVVNNLLAGNRSGVRTATIDALLLTGNDMSAQMPRHLAGDLTQHTPMFLRESRGGERAALAFRHVVADVVEPLAPAEAEAAFEACRAEAES